MVEAIDLEFTSKTETFYFEDKNADEQYEYRRDSYGNWEQRMGESWEQVYDSEDLERQFKAWLTHPRPNPTRSPAPPTTAARFFSCPGASRSPVAMCQSGALTVVHLFGLTLLH